MYEVGNLNLGLQSVSPLLSPSNHVICCETNMHWIHYVVYSK